MDSPSVRTVLQQRAREANAPGNRSDRYHVALVIECGGMRGVAAGGALQALADAGMYDAFDSIHGSSAGGSAAAYFACGQAEEGRKIYSIDISNRRAVNPLRLFHRPCIVDTDFIVDEVIARRRTLDHRRAVSSGLYLNVVTTALPSGQPAILNDFVSHEELLQALKASLRVPGPCEPGIALRGQRHIDGGLSAPIPVFSAVRAGATHILVVGTQREGDYTPASRSDHVIAAALRGLYGGEVATSYLAAQNARQGQLAGAGLAARVEIIARPSSSPFCGWYTIDKAMLARVEQDAIEAARTYLSGSAMRGSSATAVP